MRARTPRIAGALGCRAHTGWAVVVLVAGGLERPRIVLRGRVELADPAGRVRRNVYQAARGLEPDAAAAQVAAAERIAAERGADAVASSVREAREQDVVMRACAVVVGAPTAAAPLGSILASHALAHAAEGRLYQRALVAGAEACGLPAVPIPRRSIWERGRAALGVAEGDLRARVDDVRREVGPPWALDQKLAALAAWIALAEVDTVHALGRGGPVGSSP